MLRQAAQEFSRRARTGDARSRFDRFCQENSWWLDDYVLFDALREQHGNNWNQWPSPLARREPSAIEAAQRELASHLSLCRVLQFFFWEQWHALRHYCAQKSIRVVGDIAIFVDYDSADVWAHRDLFRLRDDLHA